MKNIIDALSDERGFSNITSSGETEGRVVFRTHDAEIEIDGATWAHRDYPHAAGHQVKIDAVNHLAFVRCRPITQSEARDDVGRHYPIVRIAKI
jgi:hypothetical protein